MVEGHQECRQFVNDQQWMTSCLPICKEFKITYYSKILMGQWEYLFTYLDLFNKKHHQFLNPNDGSKSINLDDIEPEEEEEEQIDIEVPKDKMLTSSRKLHD